MYKAIIICLFISIQMFSQKPKYDSKKEYKSLNQTFWDLNDRVSYMKLNMDKSVINNKIYTNAIANIRVKEQLSAIDKRYSDFNCLFTIKMSENSVFVFLISNLCDFHGKENGEVNVTFFNYTYGDADQGSIKNFVTKKKRILLKNNQFTEELVIGKMVFTINDNIYFSKMKFADKEIEIKLFQEY